MITVARIGGTIAAAYIAGTIAGWIAGWVIARSVHRVITRCLRWRTRRHAAEGVILDAEFIAMVAAKVRQETPPISPLLLAEVVSASLNTMEDPS